LNSITPDITNVDAVREILLQTGLELSGAQCGLLEAFATQLVEWNSKINLISRKNPDALWRDHILHSLAAATFVNFPPSARYLDLGSGGGLPGIPLAIVFPEAEFVLLDSIAKKINAVSDIVAALALPNVSCICARAEDAAKNPDLCSTLRRGSRPRGCGIAFPDQVEQTVSSTEK